MLRNFWEHTLNTIFRTVHWDEERCSGCLTCYEVCPVGSCRPDAAANKILSPDQDTCMACGACVLQCPQGALLLLDRKN